MLDKYSRDLAQSLHLGKWIDDWETGRLGWKKRNLVLVMYLFYLNFPKPHACSTFSIFTKSRTLLLKLSDKVWSKNREQTINRLIRNKA